MWKYVYLKSLQIPLSKLLDRYRSSQDGSSNKDCSESWEELAVSDEQESKFSVISVSLVGVVEAGNHCDVKPLW